MESVVARDLSIARVQDKFEFFPEWQVSLTESQGKLAYGCFRVEQT